MRTFRRLSALFLSFALLTGIPIPANLPAVTAEDCRAALTAEQVFAEPGQSVDVRLSLTENGGLAGLLFTVTYDETLLTLTEVKNGEIFPSLTVGRNLVFDSLTNTEKTGLLATLTFTVSEAAPKGDLEIGLIVRSATDDACESLSVSANGGAVRVCELRFTPPAKTRYVEGEPLDLSEAALTALLADNRASSVDLSAEMFSGFDSGVIGTQTVTFRRGSFVRTFDVEVTPKQAVSLEWISPPDKTEYLLHAEPLDLTGAVLLVRYDNGESETVSLALDTVTGFDTATPGVQTLTVTLGRAQTTFSITVRDRRAIGLSLLTPPDKTDYLQDKETLDLTGAVLLVRYDNGESETVSLALDTVTGFDNTTPGVQTLTVRHLGLETAFSVRILAKEVEFADATDDKEVNMKDVVLMRRYFANLDFSTGLSSVDVRAGIDPNGDGAFNLKDVVIMRQYLANFDFSTGKSSVVLGGGN